MSFKEGRTSNKHHPKERHTPNKTSDDLQAILYDLLHLIWDGHFQNDAGYVQSSLAVKIDRTTTTKKGRKHQAELTILTSSTFCPE